MTPFSILDLAPVAQGATAADALRNSLSLAQSAEKLGFLREGCRRAHHFDGGRFHDALIMGVLASEFQSQCGSASH